MALSTSTPFGLPSESRSILPPSGSAVSRVIPAARSAAEFNQSAWPSTRPSAAGRSDTAASSSAAHSEIANQFPDHLVPAIAQVPVSVRVGARILANALLRLRQALGAEKLNAHIVEAKVDDVPMRINQTRQ